MSQCIEKLEHSCGSRDGLQVFKKNDKYTGYCFSCNTYVSDPYNDQVAGYEPEKKKRVDRNDVINLINTYRTVDLPDRKLKKEYLEYFGVKIGTSEEDGSTPISHFYPYEDENEKVIAYKTRIIDGKKMWCVGSIKDTMPFGWNKAINTGGMKLFITEGEIDAVTVFQVLKEKNIGTKWEANNPAVISLPSGSSSAAKMLAKFSSKIYEHFKEIVLVFDKDKAGKLATQEALLVCPKALSVTLPMKDPNECLMAGRKKLLANSLLFKAGRPKNTRLINGSTLIDAGREQAQWGLSWPYSGMTELTRGIRFGETYYIGAGVKMGKSEFVNDIAKHMMIEHNLKVFLAKPEEANRKTWQKVVGKAVGRIFHDPKIAFDYDAYDKGCKQIGDKLIMLNLYQHMGWETLKTDIISAATDGCKIVFIDPITNLTNGINSGEANTILQEIAQELSSMANDLNIAIFIFCHLKAPQSGEPHERGGKVRSVQFSGSRAMMRSCNYMIGIEGDKNPDLSEEERNVRKLVMLEDREFGTVGTVPLYWDNKTGLFSEMED